MALVRWRRPRIRTSPVCLLQFPTDELPTNDGLVCGPPKYSEIRINFSQAFNGIGTVVSPVLGSYVFFTFSDEEAMRNVQWVYLAVAVFVFILAVVFFFSTIPEVTDADMAVQAQETIEVEDKPFWKQWKLFHAAFAQFCYTGAQVAIAG